MYNLLIVQEMYSYYTNIFGANDEEHWYTVHRPLSLVGLKLSDYTFARVRK